MVRLTDRERLTLSGATLRNVLLASVLLAVTVAFGAAASAARGPSQASALADTTPLRLLSPSSRLPAS